MAVRIIYCRYRKEDNHIEISTTEEYDNWDDDYTEWKPYALMAIETEDA